MGPPNGSKWDPKKERAINRQRGVQKFAVRYYTVKIISFGLNMRDKHVAKNRLSKSYIVIEIETSEPDTLNASKVLFWGVVFFLTNSFI